ncbi:MAG: hypothetical protein M5R36_21465 [Deltaproteobacteria bacterium]|nr:hypothetical protein [Deltaproteobacteria bacterium]
MIGRLLVFLKAIRAFESTLMCGFPLVGTVFAMRELNAATVATIVRFVVATYGLVIYVYTLNSWGGAEADAANARLGEHPLVTGEITKTQLMAVCLGGLALSFFLYLRWFPQCFLLPWRSWRFGRSIPIRGCWRRDGRFSAIWCI